MTSRGTFFLLMMMRMFKVERQDVAIVDSQMHDQTLVGKVFEVVLRPKAEHFIFSNRSCRYIPTLNVNTCFQSAGFDSRLFSLRGKIVIYCTHRILCWY